MGLLEKSENSGEKPVPEEERADLAISERVEHVDVTLSFEEHVERFRNAIGVNRKRTIKTIWEIGSFVSVLKENKTYGGKTVESFVEAMKDDAVSTSEVYKWAQFAERYTAEQVNRLLALNNIGWGVVSNLIRVKDPRARALLEDRIDSGELAPGQVQDVVSMLNKQLAESENRTDSDSENTENEGVEDSSGQKSAPPVINTNTCVGSFKKMNKFLEQALKTTDSCIKDIDDLSLILNDETRYEKAVAVMREYQELRGRLDEALREVDDLLGRTI